MLTLPPYTANLSVLKIVDTNEIVDQREDLLTGMEFNNAAGNFDPAADGGLEERAEASGRTFVEHFAKN